MAEQVTLNVNVETGEAVKNLGDLEKATKSVGKTTQQAAKSADTLEDKFDQLNKEIKDSPVNIRRMNKQIQEYQAIALEAGRTSPLGKKAIQEAAQLKDKYNDITAEVNRLANDGVKLQAALDLGTSITAGYSAFQGAMALSGVESEKLQETLVKLQAAQSLLIGVETIRKNLEKESTLVLVAKSAAEKVSTATTAAYTFVTSGATLVTKALRLALLSLPFVAIGVAIAGLIAYWDDLVSGIKSGLKWLGLYDDSEEKAQARTKARLKEERKLRKQRLEQLENSAKREQNIHDNRIANMDNEIRLAKAQGKNTADLEKQKLNAIIESTKIQNELANQRIDLLIKEREEQIEVSKTLSEGIKGFESMADDIPKIEQEILELQDERKKSAQSIKDAETDLLVFEAEATKERIDNRKKARKEKKKETDKATAEDIKAAQDKADKEVEIERKRIQDIQKLEDDLLATIEQLDEEARQRQQTEEQNEIDAVREKYFTIINTVKEGSDEELRLKQYLKDEEKAINDKFRQTEKEANDEASKLKHEDSIKELEDAQAVKAAKIQFALDGVDAIMNLTSAFAKDNEKSQRKAFEINKKLQIAQALIQTYQGVQAIFAARAASPETILFPAAPFIAAGIALTTGLANVQNIRKQKFQSGSAGGGVNAPNFNTGGGGGAPQIDPVTNTSTLLGQETQQVFVTETDITNTQNKVAVIETQATIK